MRASETDISCAPTRSGSEPAWYAAYTCANHERRVAEQFRGRGLEHFFPVYEAVHKWKDRRVRLQLPLFPGYIFVRIALRDRLRALQVTSVVRLVGFGTEPAPLDDEEIEILRWGLPSCAGAQPHPYLTIGRRVRIARGPLAGIEGVLVRRKGKCRLVISMELIERAIAVDVDAADVLPLRETPRMTHQNVNGPMPIACRGVNPAAPVNGY